MRPKPLDLGEAQLRDLLIAAARSQQSIED